MVPDLVQPDPALVTQRNHQALEHAFGVVLRADGSGPWCLVSGYDGEGVTMHFGCVPTIDALECLVIADPRAPSLASLSRNRVVEGMLALGYVVDNSRPRQLAFRKRVAPTSGVDRSALAAETVAAWTGNFRLPPITAMRVELLG